MEPSGPSPVSAHGGGSCSNSSLTVYTRDSYTEMNLRSRCDSLWVSCS